MKRLGLLFENYGAYHLARLRGGYEAGKTRGWEVEGIRMEKQSRLHDWGEFEAEEGVKLHCVESSGAGLIEMLRKLNLDALAIPGWGFDFARAALRWSRANGVTPILMSESKGDDFRRVWWKEALKSRIVRRFSSALVSGSKSREYAIRLGVSPDCVFEPYGVVGNEFYIEGSDAARAGPAAARASNPQIPSRPYFISASRFIERKNLDGMIRAYAAYRDGESEPWDLAIGGGGDLDEPLRRLAAELGVAESVHFPGFITSDNMPAWYGLAGAFIHPARSEQWGLVVNEAMASGLPVLVSRGCGCFPELVDEGKTGLGFEADNLPEMTLRLREISADASLRSRIGQAARERIAAGFSPAHFGKGLIDAAEAPSKSR